LTKVPELGLPFAVLCPAGQGHKVCGTGERRANQALQNYGRA